MIHTITVPADSGSLRLDRFLVSILPDHSRSQIQRFIKDGLTIVILCNRGDCKPDELSEKIAGLILTSTSRGAL